MNQQVTATAPTPSDTRPIFASDRSPLPAPKVILEGPTGVGKTYAIGTLVDALAKRGGEVAFLATEQGYETLYGYWTDRGLKIPDKLFVHELASPGANFGDMLDMATKVNTLSFDALIKLNDPSRQKYDQFKSLLQCLFDFTDQRTGRKLGSVDKWGTNRALVIDGLTGMSYAAMNLFVGGRIAVDQKDWGIGQKNLENLLRQITTACRCWFVLLSHIEREVMADGSGAKLTVSTLGKALAPKIPPMFSDVILCKRDGAKWVWDTADSQADLKTRNLPIAAGIPPNFEQILAKWESRGGLIEVGGA